MFCKRKVDKGGHFNEENTCHIDYIKKAKEEDSSRYQMLYNDYLAVKEANAEYKVILNGDDIELYSNISPKWINWQPVKIDDYILSNN